MRNFQIIICFVCCAFALGNLQADQQESFVDAGITFNNEPQTSVNAVSADAASNEISETAIAETTTEDALTQDVLLAQTSVPSSSAESQIEQNNADEEVEEEDEEEESDDASKRSLVDTLPWSAAPTAVGTALETESFVGGNTATALSPPAGAKSGLEHGFFPSLSIFATSEENPASFPGQDESTDTAISIQAALNYRNAINNRHPYELGVSGSFKEYDELTSLDYDNFSVYGALGLDISEAVLADIYASHAESADRRGGSASRNLGLNIENDEYETDTVGGRLTVGRRSNTFQVVLRAEQSDVNFTNNSQSHRDRENSGIGAALHWNVGQRSATSVFINVDMKDIDYLNATQSGLDSEETSTTIGVGWEPSFNTSLIFQIGNLEKDLADPALEDYDSKTYTGRFHWSPQDRTGVSLYASLLTEEAIVAGSPFIESELIGISANHSFTSKFRGNAFYNLIDDDHHNLRKDENTDFGIGFNYNLTQWLSLGANWTHHKRESNISGNDYESNLYSINAALSLTRKSY